MTASFTCRDRAVVDSAVPNSAAMERAATKRARNATTSVYVKLDSGPVSLVVIIGAGIGGLATADLLQRAGISSLTLESRSRTGGRLLSNSDGIDLGASWFWPGEHRVAALVGRFGLPVHEQHLAGDAMYDDAAQTVRLEGNPVDVAAGRFTHGADSLTHALTAALGTAANSDLRLGSHVHRISVDDAGVTVSIDAQPPIRAAHAVVALPPALAASSITFTPKLASAEQLLVERTPVWMGSITKVVAQYHSAFWRDAGLSGAAISHRGPMREVHDLSGPGGRPAALFGFAPTTIESGPIRRADVVAQLVRLFGPQAAEPTELQLTDWRTESLTSPPGVERIGDYSTFGHRSYQRPMLGGRLHWTSTETAPVSAGHIEGALAAAERTVANIIAFDPAGAPV